MILSRMLRTDKVITGRTNDPSSSRWEPGGGCGRKRCGECRASSGDGLHSFDVLACIGGLITLCLISAQLASTAADRQGLTGQIPTSLAQHPWRPRLVMLSKSDPVKVIGHVFNTTAHASMTRKTNAKSRRFNRPDMSDELY